MAARFVRRSFAAPFVVTLATLPACVVQSSGSASTGPSRQPHAHDHRTPTTTTPPPATNTPPPATHTPPPSDQVVVANPPRPTTQPAQPAQPTRPPVVAPPATTADPKQPPVIVANPPRPTTQPAQPAQPTRPPVVAPPATTADPKQPPVVVANPPRPTGAGTNPSPANTGNGTVVADTKPAPPTSERRWNVSRANGTCKAYIQTSCPTAPKGQPQPTCNPPPPTAYACPDNLADGESMKVVQRAGESECWIDWGNITCPKNAKCNPPPPRKVACPK